MALVKPTVQIFLSRHVIYMLCVTIFLAFAIYRLVTHWCEAQKTPKGLRLPPSPPGARFFGGHAHLWAGEPSKQPNISQLVLWSSELGEVYRIRVGWQQHYVFSSPKAIKEVFDKHGAVTGTRPPKIVANDVLSGGNRLIFMPYGKKWRRIRAIVHQCLTMRAVDTLKPSQDVESRQYLHDILTNPDHFLDHVKRYATSVIIYASYGFRILSLDHPVLTAIYKSTGKFGEVFVARYLVDSFPILAYLPNSLQWWRWNVDPYRKEGDKLMLGLWNDLKKRLDTGEHTGCFVEKFMEHDYPKMGISQLEAAWVAGSMIEAGADTTQLTLNSIILGLVAFPEVVQKAHKELDEVVGSRMPQFEDSPSLPYIRAIVKEVLRWRSPSNDHIRHDTTADVVYKNFFIPAGSAIIINHWAIHFDSAIYADPERFYPDRFLGTTALSMTAGECINASEINNRDHFSFGAGRRVCPGYNLAENSLFILTARLLWAFDIKAPRDPATGEEWKYDVWNFNSRRLFGPKGFPVNFKVRGAEREEQIRQGLKTL